MSHCPRGLHMMSDPPVPSAGLLLRQQLSQSTLPSLHPPWPMPGGSVAGWQLFRLACGQVMCQRHLSHLQARDSPVSNSQRNNHLPDPFFQPKTVSNKHLLNLMRRVDYRHEQFNNLSACRHRPGILLIAQGKEQHIGPALSKVR